eukprot:gene27122-35212_t
MVDWCDGGRSHRRLPLRNSHRCHLELDPDPDDANALFGEEQQHEEQLEEQQEEEDLADLDDDPVGSPAPRTVAAAPATTPPTEAPDPTPAPPDPERGPLLRLESELDTARARVRQERARRVLRDRIDAIEREGAEALEWEREVGRERSRERDRQREQWAELEDEHRRWRRAADRQRADAMSDEAAWAGREQQLIMRGDVRRHGDDAG